ncbi:unnamed protein product, partial [Callosobruchus maculatus]
MKATKIFLVLLVVTKLLSASEVKVTELSNTPGILPFKLGKANIIDRKHIFLHDINSKYLDKHIYNLVKTYTKLNSSLE